MAAQTKPFSTMPANITQSGAKKRLAQAAMFGAGAFGENLVSSGINEINICVGDIFEIGSAVLQVTQPRQPCFKLNHRFQLPSMARRVQETGRTGWYYRVLSPGQIAAGAVVRLVGRPHPDWTLRLVQHILYVDTLNERALRELVALPPLSDSMRGILAGRLAAESAESWDARLIGLNQAGATVGEEKRSGWRILRVENIAQETPTVKSLQLIDPSGAGSRSISARRSYQHRAFKRHGAQLLALRAVARTLLSDRGQTRFGRLGRLSLFA